ncbi:helix-turn-helix transcriptional regulator [Streptomyces sp. V4-01]|uniref:Helix-turn-helix transcriptional regulator n=1 Tax=Actinacidiphila polyblastidii TaxID=3110430 RepID=A0ABU7PLS8_9ACTN|nr:helix-turn-helix transcriptional regulator [Streptomyces sp. V4-01]
MPASPSSSAQAARAAVARRLRDLRKGAGWTVVELADRCGWSHAKTSRIENARTAPSTKDIRAWCRATGADALVDDLITQSLHAASMYAEWRDETRRGLRELQDSYGRLFRETALFRVYSSSLVPGLLQTEGYAGAILRLSAEFQGLPTDDSGAAAQARVDRSRIIYEAGRRFLLVVEEGVLYHQMGTEDAMAAQLGFLLTAGALPAVSLGIIPKDTAERSQWPRETFHIYDDRLVSVELVTARVRITQTNEVGRYVRAFEQLRKMAVYGADARALIVRAIDALR